MGSITDKIVNLIKEEVKENDYKYYFGVADTQGYDMKVIKGDTYEEIFNKLDVDYERLDYYIEQEGLTEEQELTEENYKDFLQAAEAKNIAVKRERILDEIRDLAKTNYYQTLFANAKEMNIQIFNNNKDFSDLQIMFLNYLNFYKVLYDEIAQSEVTSLVLKKHLYEDAYMLYRRESYKRKKTEPKEKDSPSGKRSKHKSKETVIKDWRIDMHKGKTKEK
jgi:methionine salvage enolase-phosphatase E1